MNMFQYSSQETVAQLVESLKAKRDKLNQKLSDNTLSRIFKRDGSEMFAFREVKDYADDRVIIDRIERVIDVLENEHDYEQTVPMFIADEAENLLMNR